MSWQLSSLNARFGVVSFDRSVILNNGAAAVDRQYLIARLEKAWRDFQESYAGLSDSQMMTSGVTGDWSVRDILAHVTTWE